MIWKTISVLALIVPMAMVALGLICWRCPPKGPNWLLGFRSRRARASDEVWAFAQDLAGKIWFCLGLSLLFAALLVCQSQRDVYLEESVWTYLWLIAVQIFTLVAASIGINIVLICKFDRFGRRRQPADEQEEVPLADAGYETRYDEPNDPWDEFDDAMPVEACDDDAYDEDAYDEDAYPDDGWEDDIGQGEDDY